MARRKKITRSRLFRSYAGFSLVEVLCAVLILGVALVGLTEGITAALKSNKESELQTVAATFAAGVIEALRAEGTLVAGTDSGECGPGLSKYSWQQTVTETSIEGLFDVEVMVSHSGTAKPVYDLRTMLFEAPLPRRPDAEPEQSRDRSRRSAQ